MKFNDFKISKALINALTDLGFDTPTTIQQKAFSVIMSGKDVVGLAQTGTGKTYAFLLPILNQFKFTKNIEPRTIVLVPTRELVEQIVDETNKLAKYMNVRVLGVYGGANINIQKEDLLEGKTYEELRATNINLKGGDPSITPQHLFLYSRSDGLVGPSNTDFGESRDTEILPMIKDFLFKKGSMIKSLSEILLYFFTKSIH